MIDDILLGYLPYAVAKVGNSCQEKEEYDFTEPREMQYIKRIIDEQKSCTKGNQVKNPK